MTAIEYGSPIPFMTDSWIIMRLPGMALAFSYVACTGYLIGGAAKSIYDSESGVRWITSAVVGLVTTYVVTVSANIFRNKIR